jgi:hypothetical protein
MIYWLAAMLIVVPAHLQPCPSLIYWLAAMLIPKDH